MKLTTFLILVASLELSAHGLSQTVTFSGKNVPLEKIFSVIEQQTGYVVFFDHAALDSSKTVTFSVKDAPLQNFLLQVLKGQLLDYTIKKKTIFIKNKPTVAGTVESSDQQRQPERLSPVSGRVVDSSGASLAGATVTVKKSKASGITDAEGRFRLNASAGDVLVITYVGFQSREYRVRSVDVASTGRQNDLAEIIISLSRKDNSLSNIIVTYSNGYQTVSKERVVGAYSKIDSAAYNQRTGMNILDRLDGTVSGVFFDKTGNGTAPLQIRGISTLGGGPSFNPLIIVDNFPFTGDLANINPNDIKDITILKDASAASIWGATAGNGVIVITTIKGRYNQPFQISASSNIAITQKPNLFYYPQMSSSDFIDVEKYLFNQGFYDNNLANQAYYVTSPVEDILNQQRNGTISSSEASSRIDSLRKFDVRNDYNKYVYRSALSQQHYINFSGGTQILNYNCAIGYNNISPNIQGGKNSNQVTINTNTFIRPLKNLEFSIGINLSKSVNRDASLPYPIQPGSAANYSQLYPYARLADANGNHLAVPKDYGSAFADTAGAGQLLDWHYRPLDEIRLEDNTSTTKYARINLETSYRLTNWMRVSVNYQYLTQIQDYNNYQSQSTYSTRNLINLYTQSDGNNLQYPLPLGGILDIANNQAISHNFRGQLDFRRKWKENNEFSGLVAGEISQSSSSSTRNRFYGYNSSNLSYTPNLDYSTYFPFYDFAGAGSGQIFQNANISAGSFTRIVSLLANGSYTYKDRYTLYASARRDGANVFGVNTNNKWKPLWSAGANWEITKEPFFKPEWLSSLRLRIAYGHMGNVANLLSGVPTINYSNPLPFTRFPIANIGNAPNPDLRWEDVSTINMGIDFSAFNSRLSGSIELFQKDSRDLISNIPFDPTSGVNNYTVNAASMRGKGFEFNLLSKNTTGAFVWETGFGLTYDKTIVLKFTNGGFNLNLTGLVTSYGINPIPGRLAWGLYSYKWAGLDPLTGDPQGFFNKQVSKDYPGILNDSIQNQVFNGSSIPLYSGFLSNTFTWRNISLSANITYRFDFYFRKPTISYSSLFNSWVGNADYTKRWQKPGDEKNTTVPSLDYPADANRDVFYSYSDVTALKGDNIRLQFVRLGYNWNNPSYSKFPIRSIQAFMYINNLNLILWRANKSGIDPDFTGNTIIPPPSKTWTFGMTLHF